MIEKGKAWGQPVELAGDEAVARSDAELAALLGAEWATDTAAGPVTLGPVLLVGGDLHRSLGGVAGTPGRGPHPVPEPVALPVDLVEVDVGGERWWSVAHVVARRPMWVGEFAVAMNATNLGHWNLGPKAHPNDGLIDVTTGLLSFGDRLNARRRAVSGTHVPHPALRTARVRSDEWAFERLLTVYVDGVAVCRSDTVTLTVHPDRGVVVVA